MHVVFIKEELPKRIIREIKKTTGADVVTTDKCICTPDLRINEYGRPESK